MNPLISVLIENIKLPFRYLKLALVVTDYFYDFLRYFNYSKTIETRKSKEINIAKILELCHSIEKGLVLKNTKIGFGQSKINRLINLLEKHIYHYGFDYYSRMSLKVLSDYIEFNRTNNLEIDSFQKALERFNNLDSEKKYMDFYGGAVLTIKRCEIINTLNKSFPDLVKSRHSIRDFCHKDVDIEKINKAISLAQRTPSSCNRQSARVHVFKEKIDKLKLLELQRGASGFAEEIPLLLVVTTDLSCWDNRNERNQGFIDGGMFSMSLIYALHSCGLATCPLNLALEKERDISFRAAAKIPDSESLIVMIATGEMPESFKVAQSQRRRLEEILFFH